MYHPFCRRVKSLEPAWLLSSEYAACLEPVVIRGPKPVALLCIVQHNQGNLGVQSIIYLFICFCVFIQCLRLPPAGQTVFRLIY